MEEGECDPPEGEDEDVKEKLTELLSLVVHGGGGQQRS